MDDTIHFYTRHAEALAAQYDSLDAEQVHRDWIDALPNEGLALDVGAGSGRDARFMASKGLTVYAVEPADGIREQAQRYHASPNVHWLNDSLPELRHVQGLNTKFDVILLSAVWMHIAPSARQRSFRKLSSLLKPNGKMVVSLRHGESPDERTMHPVSADELAQLAQQQGLSYKLLEPRNDELQRQDVQWQTVLLTLPDDGTGAFPLLRNIVINDNKSSTYKVALLRTLLRIAEGHPGAVLTRTQNHVTLPMGLVALYWLKLYKPLLDTYNLQQANSRGLGFVKASGWQTLQQFSANDFYIGRLITDADEARSVYRTLKDIASTIRNMPVKYITLPGSEQGVFDVELGRTQAPKNGLVLDHDFLASLGNFHVPRAIWDALTHFSVWIEPALINEWVTLMEGYNREHPQAYTTLDYRNALNWENPERSTQRVRNRVQELMKEVGVDCCWSGASIRSQAYAIDHAFPFARWPNNDLWNLLPTKTSVNAAKSDKLPTRHRLLESRELILDWWQRGWSHNAREFFTQANFALPNLAPDNQSFDDVFEALTCQRDRIKQVQQLRDW
ncbi:class I SAM-dependent methyltransferase [Pseudidiomarina sediminum]|uniref:class I SAM-dependent methyltransferase n=1 Tax=Pseudidiomarina sediminum TaxID=431675 RepID=UPI001C949726|nr:class I SAM-dependent methyltransferase [Pseudidiomarina sediminum]MBY6064516.1 methyltransferase domain-containing protein [Pseudidiomarina sediminum]